MLASKNNLGHALRSLTFHFEATLSRLNNQQRTTGSCDAVGNACIPIELLFVGVLRHLGRGVTFDDLEEHTRFSKETHRRFFYIDMYVEFGSTFLFEKYVKLPSDDDIESYPLRSSQFFLVYVTFERRY